MNLEIKNVEDYIGQFPAETQLIIMKVRSIITQNAPQAQEMIRYGMPAYKMNGKPLVYFAAYKKHIGLYATPSGHEAFAEELSDYTQGKGSVQFPLQKPIPYDLIKRIVKFRVSEMSK